MTDTLYCYCCKIHHPREQMRLFPTRTGRRWRCLRTIVAARNDRAARDAFGRQQSSLNRQATIAQAERVSLLYPGLRRT